MKISVIVPAYNVEKYIAKCIESLCAQELEDIEIILVDDGSVDNTGKICDYYAEKDSRIVVIHQKNQGISAARNAALDIARGDYIGFADGDDFIHKKMYSTLYKNLMDNNADIAVCNRAVVQEAECGDGADVFDNREPEEVLTFDKTGALKEMFGRGVFWVHVWDKVYKRELFDNIRFPIGKIHEDVYVTYKLIDKAEKVVYTNQRLYAYIQRKGSVTHREFTEKNFDGVYAFGEIIAYFKDADADLKQKIYYISFRKTRNAFKSMCSNASLKNSFGYVRKYRRFVNRHQKYFKQAQLSEEEIKHIKYIRRFGYAYYLRGKILYRGSTPKTVFNHIKRSLKKS